MRKGVAQRTAVAAFIMEEEAVVSMTQQTSILPHPKGEKVIRSTLLHSTPTKRRKRGEETEKLLRVSEWWKEKESRVVFRIKNIFSIMNKYKGRSGEIL
jgi:hypothetical protein